MSWKQKLSGFAPWLASFLTVLLRLVCLGFFLDSPLFWPLGGDRGLYQRLAELIAQGGWFDGVFTFLPLYPLLAGWVYRLTGSPDPAALAVLQALLDGVTARLLYDLVLRCYGRTAAFCAALGFALFGPSVAYSLVSMPVALGLFWTVLTATLIVRWAGNWNLPRAAGLGLCLGFGGQVLAAFWLMLPPLAVWLAVERPARSPARRIAHGVLALAAGYICLAPLLIHNFRHDGGAVLITAHGGLNLYMGNNPAATGYGMALPGLRLSAEEMTADSVGLAGRLAGRQMTPVEADRFWRARAVGFICAEPGCAFRLWLRKAQRLVSARAFDDTGLLRLLPEFVPPLRIAFLGFGGIWILACLGLALRRARSMPPGLWIMGICLAIGVMTVFVTERYRMPLAVLLLPAAGGALAALPGLVCRKPQLTGVWRLSLACAGILIAVWPHSAPDTAPADHLNLSNYLLRQGAHERAMEHARKALALHPDSPAAMFAFGNACMMQGDYQAALGKFELVLNQNPDRTDALFNAGLALENLGRPDEACRLYERLVMLEPHHAKAWFALAGIYHARRMDAKAQTALANAARQLGCDHPEIARMHAKLARSEQSD